MELSVLAKQYKLKQLIDSNGLIPSGKMELAKEQEKLALEVMENFLGCTIRVNDNDFILSNMELYYGGIGDMAHDWYRSMFPQNYNNLSRHSKNNTKAQVSRGPIYYFNQKGQGQRKRCDIVIGVEGVAVSFLIRNVLSKELVSIGKKNGQPNCVLTKMGLTDQHQSQPVNLIDTRDKVLKNGYELIKRKRFSYGKFDGFSYNCQYSEAKWNLELKLK